MAHPEPTWMHWMQRALHRLTPWWAWESRATESGEYAAVVQAADERDRARRARLAEQERRIRALEQRVAVLQRREPERRAG